MLSTLHTNDAPSSINRLVNMGIEPFLVANSLNLVCAQRLVRRICEHCKEPHEIPTAAAHRGGLHAGGSRATLSRCTGRGCDRCSGTGYKGRVGLFEVMDITEALRELIIANAPVDRAAQASRSTEGMCTLRQSGLQKVREGVTTFEEVVRETM